MEELDGPYHCDICGQPMDNDPAIDGSWCSDDGEAVICGECAMADELSDAIGQAMMQQEEGWE